MPSSRADVTVAIASAAAVVLSIISIGLTVYSNHKLDLQNKQQLAARVSLQEAPLYACRQNNNCNSKVQWVVANYNTAQISDIWVQGSGGRSVQMFNVPACEMYALPTGFLPTTAHFRDEFGEWKVPVSGLPVASPDHFPKKDTDDSPWVVDIANC